MNRPALFIATVAFGALLVLLGCAGPTGPSGSDGSASDPGDGASNTTEYGFNLVNTGSGGIEFAIVDETDSGAFVDEVLDSITVTGGSGTNFFALE